MGGTAVLAAVLPAGPALAQKGKPQPPPPPPIVYSLTVLNGTGEYRWTGMNDHGDVVGTIGGVTSRVAVIWPAGSTDPVDLNSFVDPTLDVALVTATAINNSGQIAGMYLDGITGSYGNYRLSFPDPDPPIFESILEVNGYRPVINQAGDVLTAFGSQLHIFTDETGTFEVENTIFPGEDIYGNGINNAGEVVGFLYPPGGECAFHCSIGTSTMVNLNPPGSTRSVAQDINEAGDIAGYHWPSSPAAWQACVWSAGGGFVPLGSLAGSHSVAIGINDNGLVVGQSTAYKPKRNDPPAPDVAFLYINGKMHRLLAEIANGGLIANGQLPGGWAQMQSFGWKINDANQICGFVILPGGNICQRFLLTPIGP
jgi:hypothetical protein